MTNPRPVAVGIYELLTDFDQRSMSVRVFRLSPGEQQVDLHKHRYSTQVYVALEGQVAVHRDGVETVLAPYQALEVIPGMVHGARAIDDYAVVMNISVPPLAVDDQSPLSEEPHPADMDMPRAEIDVDD
jgi:quercetin dioxygenase-like cupin family protein